MDLNLMGWIPHSSIPILETENGFPQVCHFFCFFLYDFKLFVSHLLGSSGELVLWIVPGKYVFYYPYLVTIQLIERCNFVS